MERLDRHEAIQILQSAPVAHLGIIDGDEPYVTPMSFVLSGDHILFRTMPGRKLDALRQSPAVCINVTIFDETTGDWSSVIVKGEAHEVDEDDLKTTTVALLLRKYESVMGSPLSSAGIRPLNGPPTFVAVRIDEISGMSSGRGLAARTRPGRL